MAARNQARISLRKKMVSRDLKLKQLAVMVGHDAATVSKAINHGRFPRVLAKVKEVLGG